MNMIKKIIPVLILLFRSTTALTQDAVTAALQKDWQEYQSRTYQEKIFVHPDKTFFLAGETLWFTGIAMPFGIKVGEAMTSSVLPSGSVNSSRRGFNSRSSFGAAFPSSSAKELSRGGARK